jgi:tRNA-dihydrouridine synthase
MLRDIPKMLEITKKVVEAVNVPVTVKTRLGWDDSSRIIVDLAESLQDCGIAALAIHGRTRAQMYTGEADWSLIGAVKNNARMTIPIIGNGDVTSPEIARRRFDETGVDAVMIGRASIGRPWFFEEVKQFLLHGNTVDEAYAHFDTTKGLIPHSFKWKLEIIKQQVEDSVRRLDERRGIVHIRRHLAATPVFKGIPNFKETRIAMLRAETVGELFQIIDSVEEIVVNKL